MTAEYASLSSLFRRALAHYQQLRGQLDENQPLPSSESLLYQAAVKKGNHGAGREFLGDKVAALASYEDGRLLLEHLHQESTDEADRSLLLRNLVRSKSFR